MYTHQHLVLVPPFSTGVTNLFAIAGHFVSYR